MSACLHAACGNTGRNADGSSPPNGGTAGASGSGSGGAGVGGSLAEDGSGGEGDGDSAGAATTQGGESGAAASARIEVLRDAVPNKLDLLLMVDNSISMIDKQQLLADAMQHLVARLVTPRCLDEDGMNAGQQAVCPAGSQHEFPPFRDIHAAVISSSLGSHGATGTRDVCTSADEDDHARLLSSLRPDLPSAANWNGAGFLVWDPEQQRTPAGLESPTTFAQALSAVVEAAGDQGCGYEAQLEAWYRFLIDPEPPASIVVNNTRASLQGIDQVVLDQREAFLRSDSLLAIVMLTDENDCSIVDEGYGWLVARAEPMFRSTSQCLENPNDACCQSCGEAQANAGCPALASDSECVKGNTYGSGTVEDDLNLRCFEQKRRFGFDLLHPVERYVSGITAPQVPERTGELVPNPIYVARKGAPPRAADQVLLMGMVGVPWQDVATPASLEGDELEFLSESGLLPPERWAVILGDPTADPPVLPSDPFMVETPLDRTTIAGLPQANPIVPQEKLVSATSTDPRANAINGHESVNVRGYDLQYACTFELAQPLLCDDTAEQQGSSCDCFVSDAEYNRALCQPPGGGATGITQYFGKAYPGLRELQVLKGIGGRGIVASACPKDLPTNSPSYGYRPAMNALAGRVSKQLGRSCLSSRLDTDDAGQLKSCSVITAFSGACACNADQGLSPVPDGAQASVRAELEQIGYCGGALPCSEICLCELEQRSGGELAACQTQSEAGGTPGYCYLSAAAGEPQFGSAGLASDCIGGAPRRIRFVGGAPAAGSLPLLYCSAASP
jgi:hypothetical protein